jgi:hypothetical protein
MLSISSVSDVRSKDLLGVNMSLICVTIRWMAPLPDSPRLEDGARRRKVGDELLKWSEIGSSAFKRGVVSILNV